MSEEQSREFTLKWVRPLYMAVYNPSRHEPELLSATQALWSELDDDIIAQLLNSPDWRSRSCGAFYAALNCSQSNQTRIEELLLESNRVYADRSYCHALAAMNNSSAVRTLIEYVTRRELTPSGNAHSVDALSALKHLDTLNGTAFAPRVRDGFMDNSRFSDDMVSLTRIREALAQ